MLTRYSVVASGCSDVVNHLEEAIYFCERVLDLAEMNEKEFRHANELINRVKFQLSLDKHLVETLIRSVRRGNEKACSRTNDKKEEQE